MSAWSCPHDLNGVCQKVLGAVCDPGMRGCELEGRFRFANADKNEPRKPVRAEVTKEAPTQPKTNTAPTPKRRLPF
ncbi:hypothetical protein [Uliginosibacterium gangwonense]|uniref:hypothetical protein n=1 Tax=Uliginosibacterium gangwonense TaxID=392736 RepID=UPI000375D1A0|nr:hypothetical protein [Uliginosibacterium gangwonense]